MVQSGPKARLGTAPEVKNGEHKSRGRGLSPRVGLLPPLPSLQAQAWLSARATHLPMGTEATSCPLLLLHAFEK
jgi:hypothetical protein